LGSFFGVSWSSYLQSYFKSYPNPTQKILDIEGLSLPFYLAFLKPSLRPILSQQKTGTIIRYDFVVGDQNVPKICLCDRIEKDGWDAPPNLPALISSYLAGDNTSSKKLPATKDSTV
jgi:hypothetical protein